VGRAGRLARVARVGRLARVARVGRGLPGLGRLWPVVGEEVPPGPVDGAWIGLVALIELVYQEFVRPEVGAGRPDVASPGSLAAVGVLLAGWRLVARGSALACALAGILVCVLA